MREFLYVPLVDVCEAALKTPWLSPAFVRQYRSVFRGYPSRIKLFGPLPSFQEHMDRLRHNRRFFGVRSSPGPELLAEVRYPFTDRDFREFAYAIPREQVVGVGKRRYLLKRALAGNVPDEVLNRRRKRSEEHTSELQSQSNLVCRLLLEKKKLSISSTPS